MRVGAHTKDWKWESKKDSRDWSMNQDKESKIIVRNEKEKKVKALFEEMLG